MIYTIDKSAGVGRSSYQWKASIPKLIKPVITGTKNIGGVKHYTGEKGKLYVAEAFDKMFTPLGGVIKPKGFKG